MGFCFGDIWRQSSCWAFLNEREFRSSLSSDFFRPSIPPLRSQSSKGRIWHLFGTIWVNLFISLRGWTKTVLHVRLNASCCAPLSLCSEACVSRCYRLDLTRLTSSRKFPRVKWPLGWDKQSQVTSLLTHAAWLEQKSLKGPLLHFKVVSFPCLDSTTI